MLTTKFPTILRYYLRNSRLQQVIEVQAGAIITSVGYYNTRPALFALIPDPSVNEREQVDVIVAPASTPLPVDIGTYQYLDYLDHDGQRLHIFIRRNQS